MAHSLRTHGAWRIESYEPFRDGSRYAVVFRPGESFSDVVLRAHWPDVALTAGELLAR